MRGWRGRGLLALLVSLVAVGVIRSAIPEGMPTEIAVFADDAGVARTHDVTVAFLGVETSSRIRPAGEFSDDRFVAAPGTALVLCRFVMTAHGGPFRVHTQIRTSDGYSYEALTIPGFKRVVTVDIGTTVTATYVYEVPMDKLSGTIAIHGPRRAGVQPVFPVVMQELPADLALEVGESVVPDVEIVAAE